MSGFGGKPEKHLLTASFLSLWHAAAVRVSLRSRPLPRVNLLCHRVAG